MAGAGVYNVYIVTFRARFSKNADHEGIALVDAEEANQGAGKFYQVTGDPGLGMDYEVWPDYQFAASKSFKGSALQFQIAKADLAAFEAITHKYPPPHDERSLYERRPDPPVRDCSAWVQDVLGEAQTTLKV